MLSIEALTEAVMPFPAPLLISPSAHPFMRRVRRTQYVFDPYKESIRRSSGAMASDASVVYPTAAVSEGPCVKVPTPKKVCTPKKSDSPKKLLVPRNAVRYATVAFKHSTAQFIAPFRIAPGDMVVVEGDRGEAAGVVRSITVVEPTEPVTVKVLRRAKEPDMEKLREKNEKEAEATQAIKEIARSVKLHAEVVDTEYQFDMNKLTVYVDRPACNAFVDFRKLQRTLFRQFHCRIWCAYMDEVEM